MSEYLESDKFLDHVRSLMKRNRSKYERIRQEKLSDIESGIDSLKKKYKSKIESLLNLPRFFSLKGLEEYLKNFDSLRRKYSRCLESLYYFEGLCNLLIDVYEKNKENYQRIKAVRRDVKRISFLLDDLVDPNSPNNYFNNVLSLSYELIEKYKPWLKVHRREYNQR